MLLVLPLFAADYEVLFLGNSYTFYNDLPSLVEQMGNSFGEEIIAESSTPGGYTLWEHTTNTTTLAFLDEPRFDFVVMQDQSQMPVIPYYRDLMTYPGGEILSDMAQSVCAEPMFFMTWGSEIGGAQCIDGHCSPDYPSYYGYQDSLITSYSRLADLLGVSCAPVGIAWRRCYELRPDLPYWSGDGRHPAIHGSYIACCVFYSMFTGNPTTGASYRASLSEEDALFIQNIADSIVFLDGVTWNRISTTVIADFVYTNDGPTFFFEDSSTNADTYIWNFGDGSSSTARNSVHEFSVDGEYTVTLISIGPCGSDTVETTISVFGALVSEETITIDKNISVSLSSEQLTIFAPEDERILYSRLLDISGRQISSGSVMAVDHLKAGMYFVQVKTNKQVYSKSICIGIE